MLHGKHAAFGTGFRYGSVDRVGIELT